MNSKSWILSEIGILNPESCLNHQSWNLSESWILNPAVQITSILNPKSWVPYYRLPDPRYCYMNYQNPAWILNPAVQITWILNPESCGKDYLNPASVMSCLARLRIFSFFSGSEEVINNVKKRRRDEGWTLYTVKEFKALGNCHIGRFKYGQIKTYTLDDSLMSAQLHKIRAYHIHLII